MICRNRNISRRSVIRGAGATLALPMLEIMGGRSRARSSAVGPVRAAFFYVPNGVVQRSWHPDATGRDYQLSPTLKPLEPVREKVTVLTNLDRVKVAGTDGHAQAGACWLSSAAPDELSPAGYPLKKTIDQIIAAEVGKQTAFRSLELSCNPYEDNRESIYFDNISWYGHGHVARSLRDPKEVFNRLFSVKDHVANKSVLDVVLDDARSLEHELGRGDRDKLGEYLESVRTVEKQIERVAKRQNEIDGLKIAPPVKPWQAMSRSEFIQVMGDLMILALRCDLTRVATVMSSPERWGSPLTVHGLFNKPVDHHGMTHGQGNARVRSELESLDRFHVEQFATLVAKMDKIEEGEGTLLDNMIFTFGSGISDGSLHVYTDLPTVVAGRAGGALDAGRHVKSAQGTPIANLWLSMAQMMGLGLDRIGDSTGSLKLG
ncbi:MAG: DUF1552 domain-containing protein [Verrucomicrobiales bacterium]|nr:DUF1552 domain-containing protein [Verrucomicrobiales bacterium]